MPFDSITPATLPITVTAYPGETYILSATDASIANELNSFASLSPGLHDQLAEHISHNTTLSLHPNALLSAPELRSYRPSALDLPESLFANLENLQVEEPYLVYYIHKPTNTTRTALLRLKFHFSRPLGSGIWGHDEVEWESTLPAPPTVIFRATVGKLVEFLLPKVQGVLDRSKGTFTAKFLHDIQESLVLDAAEMEDFDVREGEYIAILSNREAAARKLRAAEWKGSEVQWVKIEEMEDAAEDEKEEEKKDELAMCRPKWTQEEREEKMERLREKYLGWKREAGEKPKCFFS